MEVFFFSPSLTLTDDFCLISEMVFSGDESFALHLIADSICLIAKKGLIYGPNVQAFPR